MASYRYGHAKDRPNFHRNQSVRSSESSRDQTSSSRQRENFSRPHSHDNHYGTRPNTSYGMTRDSYYSDNQGFHYADDNRPSGAQFTRSAEVHDIFHSSSSRSFQRDSDFRHSASSSGSFQKGDEFRHSASSSRSFQKNDNFRHSASSSGSFHRNDDFRHSASSSGSFHRNNNFRDSASSSGSFQKDDEFRLSASSSRSFQKNDDFRHPASSSRSLQRNSDFRHSSSSSRSFQRDDDKTDKRHFDSSSRSFQRDDDKKHFASSRSFQRDDDRHSASSSRSFQRNDDFKHGASTPHTSYRMSKGSSPIATDNGSRYANNFGKDLRMPSEISAAYECHQDFPHASTEFPKSQYFHRNNDPSFTYPGTNTCTSNQMAGYPSLSSTEDYSQDVEVESDSDGQIEKDSDSDTQTKIISDGQIKNDSDVEVLRKVALGMKKTKKKKPPKSKIHSAAARLGVHIEFNTQKVKNEFISHLFVHGINVASGRGSKMKASRHKAFETAAQKLQMPHLRIFQTTPNSKELEASQKPFTKPLPKPSEVPVSTDEKLTKKKSSEQSLSMHKEYSRESAAMKKRHQCKPLNNFIIMEPKNSMSEKNVARTLKRSADFNSMLLENEYFFDANQVKCVVRLENETLAEGMGKTKNAATSNASFKALLKLKKFCWVIKTKFADERDVKSSRRFLNRGEFGPPSSEVTAEFRKKLQEVLDDFVNTSNQEELLFNCNFSKEERILIHKECKKMGLQSRSNTQSGTKTFIGVKRPFQKLFEHLKSIGGENAKYYLIAPEQDGGAHNASSDLEVEENASAISQSQTEYGEGVSDQFDDFHTDLQEDSFDDSGRPLYQSRGATYDWTQRKRPIDMDETFDSSHFSPSKIPRRDNW